MMKKLVIVIVVLAGLVSCKFAAKEIKKVNQIRKSAKEVCHCRFVGVESDYNVTDNSVTITIRRSASKDFSATADSIILNVQKDFPKLCNHDEVFIIFESEEYDIEYTYYGCDLSKKVDTFFYDFNEFEEFEDVEIDSLLESTL